MSSHKAVIYIDHILKACTLCSTCTYVVKGVLMAFISAIDYFPLFATPNSGIICNIDQIIYIFYGRMPWIFQMIREGWS